MSSSRTVSSVKELKKALDDKVDSIVIADRKLAFAVRVIKATRFKHLAVIVGAAGILSMGFWNPGGVGVGAAVGAAGGTALAVAFNTVGGAGAAATAGISGSTAAIIISVILVVGALGLAALVMHKDYHWEVDVSADGQFDATDSKPLSGSAVFKTTLKRNGT